jgi:hypothetical protein
VIPNNIRLALLLSLTGAQCVSAQPQPIAKFPFRVESGLAFIEATVNGVPISITMDTGAPGIALDPSLVERARIQIVRREPNGIDLARIDSLSLGSFVVRNEQVRIRSFDAVNDSASGRPPVLGVIGTAFFRRYVTELDFANHVVTLYDPATFVYRGAGISVPITFRAELPVVTAMIAREAVIQLPPV